MAESACDLQSLPWCYLALEVRATAGAHNLYLPVTCYSPVTAYRSRVLNPETGRFGISFNSKDGHIDLPVKLPCGNCIGCRIARSQMWAVRCMHEAQLHDRNCFITLTYSNDHLPEDYSVHVRTWQLFMKRLRKSLGGKKIRSFACGEYGDQDNRPHYHALLFGHDFNDKCLLKKTRDGNPLYTSSLLQKVWPYGHSTIGNLDYKSAAYVARYCMKKINGSKADDHYWRLNPLIKQMVRVQPEFATQSRRPGLGATWLERYKTDAYPSDFVIMDGKKMKPPRFYDQRLTEEELEETKRRRKLFALGRRSDNTPARLKQRETVQQAKLGQLKRNLGEDQ